MQFPEFNYSLLHCVMVWELATSFIYLTSNNTTKFSVAKLTKFPLKIIDRSMYPCVFMNVESLISKWEPFSSFLFREQWGQKKKKKSKYVGETLRFFIKSGRWQKGGFSKEGGIVWFFFNVLSKKVAHNRQRGLTPHFYLIPSSLTFFWYSHLVMAKPKHPYFRLVLNFYVEKHCGLLDITSWLVINNYHLLK